MSRIHLQEDIKPTDLLIEAMESIEKADEVVILISSPESLIIKTSCNYRNLNFLLDQAKYLTLADVFGHLDTLKKVDDSDIL